MRPFEGNSDRFLGDVADSFSPGVAGFEFRNMPILRYPMIGRSPRPKKFIFRIELFNSAGHLRACRATCRCRLLLDNFIGAPCEGQCSISALGRMCAAMRRRAAAGKTDRYGSMTACGANPREHGAPGGAATSRIFPFRRSREPRVLGRSMTGISLEPVGDPRTLRARMERPVQVVGCADTEEMSFFFQYDVVFCRKFDACKR